MTPNSGSQEYRRIASDAKRWRKTRRDTMTQPAHDAVKIELMKKDWNRKLAHRQHRDER